MFSNAQILLIPVITFVIGVILVVKGGDLFVDAASWIAKAAKIPAFVIGATIVSIATTLPEMIVSCIAADQGKIDMAIGNAVGSVSANTGLIMAIALLFMHVVARRKDFLWQCLILISSVIVLWVGSLSGYLSEWASLLLVLLFVICMVLNLNHARRSNEISEPMLITKKTTIKHIGIFVLGAFGIVLGSRFLVDGGSELAYFFHVPERIIAVTLVAIGTSLPELVTTLTAIRKKQSDLSIGNIIGANIIDISLILPLCSLINKNPIPVSNLSLTLDIPFCLLLILIALIPLILREKSTKFQGILMLATYGFYLFLTI